MLAGEDLVQKVFGSDASGGDDSRTGPVTLPADPEIFTGRAALLDELLERLNPGGEQAGVTVVSAVDGMAGVGKTALAIHAARMAHERGWFPGGVLLENMRGFSADDPVDFGSTAARLLRALGDTGDGLPDTPEGWRAAWLDRLARLGEQGRPLLVVLDNVARAGQVSPLVPGRPPHKMIIKSRHTLSALAAYRVPSRPSRRTRRCSSWIAHCGPRGPQTTVSRPSPQRRACWRNCAAIFRPPSGSSSPSCATSLRGRWRRRHQNWLMPLPVSTGSATTT